MGLVKIAVIGAMLYGVLVGGLYMMQRRLQYHPTPTRPDLAAAAPGDMVEVMLHTEDGLALLSWYGAAAAGRPTVVFFHGNAGNIADRAFKARLFRDHGFGVLLVGYRGYGGNPGQPSEAGFLADGRAAMAYLAAAGVAAAETVLYGESLGGGVAVAMAAERPVAAGLILEASFTSAAAVAAGHYWYVPAGPLLRDKYRSAERLAAVDCPVLIIHGEQDRVVPVSHAHGLYAAAGEPKVLQIFPEAGHNDLYDHGGWETILQFMEDDLRRE